MGHVACKKQKEYSELVGKPEGKRQSGRPHTEGEKTVNQNL
jgi:hypothetical protein